MSYFIVDSKAPDDDWKVWSEGPVTDASTDPTADALAIAVDLGLPPGSGAFIAWDATVRVRVWEGEKPADGVPCDGEYVYDALAQVASR